MPVDASSAGQSPGFIDGTLLFIASVAGCCFCLSPASVLVYAGSWPALTHAPVASFPG